VFRLFFASQGIAGKLGRQTVEVKPNGKR